MAKDIDCNKCYHSEVCAYKMTFKDTIMSCNEYIPTADVEEVKHGEWVGEYGYYPNCSLCGTKVKQMGGTNYCPNCGAKMDGTPQKEG